MTDRAAYPLKEAAELLGGISRGTFYNLEARGELRMIRVGKRVLVPASEIRRLLQEPEDSPWWRTHQTFSDVQLLQHGEHDKWQ